MGAGVVGDHTVPGSLECLGAHHDVAPRRGQAVEQHDGRPMTMLLGGQTDSAGLDQLLGHPRFLPSGLWTSPRAIFRQR